MAYETLPDGSKRWTRNGRMARGTKPPRRNYGGLRKVGKQGRENARALRVGKARHEAEGRTVCEGGFDGCTRDNYLSLAHRRKRRHIETEAELLDTLVLCWNCHWHIEKGGEERMMQMYDEIKARRAA